MIGYSAPRPLEPDDEISGFVCRSEQQTEWLVRHARQAHSSGTSKVLVVCLVGSREVVAYYAWCMGSVLPADAPARMLKGAGRYKQPVVLLSRLGVALGHEGRGLGAGLLKDALTRTLAHSTDLGCRGLLLHAESEDAVRFYRHIEEGFMSLPGEPNALVLLTKDIRRSLRHSGP